LPRGAQLGQVVNQKSFHLSAIVSQQEVSRLFAGEILGSEVRLFGQAGIALPVTAQKIIPAERQTLPSAAIGWRSGGEVAVDLTDRSGVHTKEPFFQLRATVAPQPQVALLHGRSGKIRFDLPNEPLLSQWMRKLWQLLQKRYAL
jgi:putative peptide zinc metalloprotease protein